VRDDPKAFIFDLDGVITDTAEFHYLAWKQLGEEVGVKIDRKFNEQLKGIGRMESLEMILALNPTLLNMSYKEKEKLAAKKNRHYQKLITSITSEHILPGIVDLLIDIRCHGIKIALGSASKNAHLVLKQLGLTDVFDYVVDAAKIELGKPDPETFTNAADYLQVLYSDCVGIEDAAAGIQALKTAGMFAVGIGKKDNLLGADMIVSETAELSFDDIVNHYKLTKAYYR
jgi:beta-phosphoglucomutase